MVNIELLKSNVVGANVLLDPEDVEDVEAEGAVDTKDEPILEHGYSLCDRSGIHPCKVSMLSGGGVKENDL